MCERERESVCVFTRVYKSVSVCVCVGGVYKRICVCVWGGGVYKSV